MQSCASKRRSTLFQIALVSRILTSAIPIAAQELIVTTIPITLLWVVRLNLRLKLEVCAVFCLTLFTMIAAVVRVAMSLKGKREDDSWLFSWSAVESAIGTVPLSMRLLYVKTFLSNSFLINPIAIIISCLVAYRVSLKKEPVKKRYHKYTNTYLLRNTTSSSSTNLRQREIGRGDKPSSTRIADEENLSVPQAIYSRNDLVHHQTSI